MKLDPRFKLIFEGVTGSQLYGTATPESDTDIRGVFIPTEEFYIGILENVEQVESHEPDTTYWELRKFLKLCLDANPNIIELLFIPTKTAYCLVSSDEWDLILRYREAFLSTKAQHTFSGYAVSQLHRIKQHREWLLNPPKKKPERKDFGLPATNIITRDQVNAYDELKNRNEVPIVSQNFLEILAQEKAYFNAARYWEQYEHWKKERNPARADLEAKYGYDTKHAAHLCRLLGEGKELLTKGTITFPRPDAKDLLDIRNGLYPYDVLMASFGGDIDHYFDGLQEQFVLPHSPDRKIVDALCQLLIKIRINQK